MQQCTSYCLEDKIFLNTFCNPIELASVNRTEKDGTGSDIPYPEAVFFVFFSIRVE